MQSKGAARSLLTPLLLPLQLLELRNHLPPIDASLGLGMVGGVKATYVVSLALVLGAGCASTSTFTSDPSAGAAETKSYRILFNSDGGSGTLYAHEPPISEAVGGVCLC
jgi:hypothetical protein